jgi:small subunit ribosomal protein S20
MNIHGFGDAILFVLGVDRWDKISYHTPFLQEIDMAQHKSAKRQWRRSLRRNEINTRNRSLLRTQIKNLRAAIDSKNSEEAQKLLPQTFSLIDRSIKKGAIHENTGNRYKSRLSRQVEIIGSSAAK